MSDTPTPGSEALSVERLREIRERVDAATPGPWTKRESVWEGTWTVEGPRGFDERRSPYHVLLDSESDATFIAASRTDVPDLLDAVEQLTTENANLVCKHCRDNDFVERSEYD